MLNMANLFETDSSKKTNPVNGGRREPMTTYSEDPNYHLT